MNKPKALASFALVIFAFIGIMGCARDTLQAMTPPPPALTVPDVVVATPAPAGWSAIMSLDADGHFYCYETPASGVGNGTKHDVGLVTACTDPRDASLTPTRLYAYDWAQCIAGEPVAIWAARCTLLHAGQQDALAVPRAPEPLTIQAHAPYASPNASLSPGNLVPVSGPPLPEKGSDLTISSGEGRLTGVPGNIIFALSGTPVLELFPDGKAEVRGHPVHGDQAVYDAFKDWLNDAWKERCAVTFVSNPPPCPSLDGGATLRFARPLPGGGYDCTEE